MKKLIAILAAVLLFPSIADAQLLGRIFGCGKSRTASVVYVRSMPCNHHSSAAITYPEAMRMNFYINQLEALNMIAANTAGIRTDLQGIQQAIEEQTESGIVNTLFQQQMQQQLAPAPATATLMLPPSTRSTALLPTRSIVNHAAYQRMNPAYRYYLMR